MVVDTETAPGWVAAAADEGMLDVVVVVSVVLPMTMNLEKG